MKQGKCSSRLFHQGIIIVYQLGFTEQINFNLSIIFLICLFIYFTVAFLAPVKYGKL